MYLFSYGLHVVVFTIDYCHVFVFITNTFFIGEWYFYTCTGADPGFQVRGGARKKIAPSGGRREHFWGISCEKSRFYAKKSYFSNGGGRRENFWGISCEKSRFYAKKSYFPPPGSAPAVYRY